MLDKLDTLTINDALSLPADVRVALRDVTVATTMQAAMEGTKVFQLRQSLDERTLTKLVIFILAEFQLSLKIDREKCLDTFELMQEADWFLDTYTHDSIKDLVYALKTAKEVGMKDLKFRFTHDEVVSILRHHFEQKARHVENQYRDQKAAEATDERGLLRAIAESNAPEAAATVKALLKSKVGSKVNATPEMLQAERDRDQREVQQHADYLDIWSQPAPEPINEQDWDAIAGDVSVPVVKPLSPTWDAFVSTGKLPADRKERILGDIAADLKAGRPLSDRYEAYREAYADDVKARLHVPAPPVSKPARRGLLERLEEGE